MVAIAVYASRPGALRFAPRVVFPAVEGAYEEDEGAVSEVAETARATAGWMPTFVDYLYLSLTN